jgi:hypothetical protein
VAFLSSIIGGNFIGAQGIQGTQGIQGLQGTQSRQGTQGLQGVQSTQGTQGLSNQGTQGLQGTIGPASSWTLVKKTTDESRNNNVTTANDSELLFSMTSGVEYAIRGKIFYTTTAAADLKYRFSGPTTSSVLKYVRVTNTNGTGANPFLALGLTTSLDTVDIALTDNASGLVIIELDAVVIPSATGNFAFQWAQNTSNAGPTTVYGGSYFEYTVI